MKEEPNTPVASVAEAASHIGRRVRMPVAVTTVRELGAVSFLRMRDASGEMQAIASGEVAERLKRMRAPFRAWVSGATVRRPNSAQREKETRGDVEFQIDDLVDQGSLPQERHERGALAALLEVLRRAGFSDLRTLLDVHGCMTASLAAVSRIGALRTLVSVLPGCRWFFISAEALYFGLSPGAPSMLRTLLSAQSCDQAALNRLLNEAQVEIATIGDEPGWPCVWARLGFDVSADADTRASTSFARAAWRIEHLAGSAIEAGLAAGCENGVRAMVAREDAERSEVLAEAGFNADIALADPVLLHRLARFDLHIGHVKFLFELFPRLRAHLVRSTPAGQFDTIWSLLGHQHVHALLQSVDDRERLRRLVATGVVRDFQSIRFLDRFGLEALTELSDDLRDTGVVSELAHLMKLRPANFSTSVQWLSSMRRSAMDWRRGAALVEAGVASKAGLVATLRYGVELDDVLAWQLRIVRELGALLTAAPVDVDRCLATAVKEGSPWTEVLSALGRDDAIFDLVQLIYSGGVISYGEARELFGSAADCSDHWSVANIAFGGERWDADVSALRLSGGWLFPSKNRAAILAKSCSGICSARDAALFVRADHFQFTFALGDDLRAGGTVQLYLTHDETERPAWVIRGLNPSERIMPRLDATGFTLEVLDALVSLARFNGCSNVLLGDGAGLFNADSGRPEIRAVLRAIAAEARPVKLAAPLDLFSYRDVAVSINEAYLLSSDLNAASVFAP